MFLISSPKKTSFLLAAAIAIAHLLRFFIFTIVDVTHLYAYELLTSSYQEGAIAYKEAINWCEDVKEMLVLVMPVADISSYLQLLYGIYRYAVITANPLLTNSLGPKLILCSIIFAVIIKYIEVFTKTRSPFDDSLIGESKHSIYENVVILLTSFFHLFFAFQMNAILNKSSSFLGTLTPMTLAIQKRIQGNNGIVRFNWSMWLLHVFRPFFVLLHYVVAGAEVVVEDRSSAGKRLQIEETKIEPLFALLFLFVQFVGILDMVNSIFFILCHFAFLPSYRTKFAACKKRIRGL